MHLHKHTPRTHPYGAAGHSHICTHTGAHASTHGPTQTCTQTKMHTQTGTCVRGKWRSPGGRVDGDCQEGGAGMWRAMCHRVCTQHVHVHLRDSWEGFCCGLRAREPALCLGVSVWLWMSVRVLYVGSRVHLCVSACGSVWGGCLHVNLYVTVCLPMCDCVRLYAACWSCVSVSGPACENLCSSLCEFMCLRGVCVSVTVQVSCPTFGSHGLGPEHPLPEPQFPKSGVT